MDNTKNINYTKFNEQSISKYSKDDIDCFDDDDSAISFLKDKDSFRAFNIGIADTFKRKGIDIDPEDKSAMASYLFSRLKAINATVEKETVYSWIDGSHRPKVEAGSRKRIYEICFALNLNTEETIWFFQHVYYDRAFNCHTIEEAVFYFAFSNGLSYKEALEIINIVNGADAPAGTNYEGNYTRFIQKRIKSMNSIDELIPFLIANRENFKAWNKTAGKTLKKLADEIILPARSKPKVDKLKRMVSRYQSAKDHYKNSSKTSSIYEEIRPEDYKDCGLIVREIIFDSIYDNYDLSQYEYIKELMSNNNYTKISALLRHLLTTSEGTQKADYIPYIVRNNFPTKKIISDLLSEEKISTSRSYDSIRKMIILLDFYRFWVNIKLSSKNDSCMSLSKEDQTKTYIEETDACLYDCGYENLYAGNPYDWIFLCAANSDEPLVFFKAYFSELLPEQQV